MKASDWAPPVVAGCWSHRMGPLSPAHYRGERSASLTRETGCAAGCGRVEGRLEMNRGDGRFESVVVLGERRRRSAQLGWRWVWRCR
ncbi:hypothetical protein DAI22_01g207100 [Oryza sativa Japonica Group]|nr:hypothetical protein DAI22_01g207100 [Oryza sativa Japonica Group]